MRPAVTALLCLVLGMTACRPAAPASPAHSAPPGNPSAPPSPAPAAGLPDHPPTASPQPPAPLPRPPRYTLALTLSDDLQRVDGAAQIEYTNNDPAALSDIYLWLYPNLLGGAMSVTNLRLDGAPATPTLLQDGALLRLPLPAPLPPGGRLTLSMDFTVTIPTTPVSNYGVLSLMDGVLALAHAYPMLAVYDENGWRITPPSPYGDIVYADAADYDVTLHAPAGWVLAASGEETLTPSADGRQTLHVTIGPARDFYLAASPAYDILSQDASGVQINVYAPASQRPRAAEALNAAARALECFSARYGPYPYPELDIVVTPNFALGIEYPGIIALTSRLLTGELSPLYLESTVVHEVAHQWFYNLVGNDQVNEPWLDESLSQFATWQYYTDLTGSEANPYRDTFTARWAAVDNEPIPIGQPVAAYDGAAYSAIIYGRGALFLIELRQRMGVAAFDAFLRDYTTTYAWGIANTSGFRALAEQHCACSLAALFDAWVLP